MTNFSETELNNILKFTNALADRLQSGQQVDFGSMPTTPESLDEAEREAVAFAERRKAGLSTSRSTFGDTEADADELNEIRENIRNLYKRQRRRVNG